MNIVLQKYISESGYCSRRKAEEFIRAGVVFVNGAKAELGMRVSEGDKVEVNKKEIKNDNKKVYIILNKPKGYTCTNREFKGEKNVFELLGDKKLKGLHVVGRLDKDSSGLVILTNDGALTQKVTHPSFGSKKVYIVRITSRDELKKAKIKFIIDKFLNGVKIGNDIGKVKAKYIKYIKNNLFEVTLVEGKKRQIREMFRVVGCHVVDLQRVEVAGIRMDKLKEGEWRFLTKEEIILLNKK